jgi:hypothetical protein
VLYFWSSLLAAGCCSSEGFLLGNSSTGLTNQEIIGRKIMAIFSLQNVVVVDRELWHGILHWPPYNGGYCTEAPG